MLHYINQEIHTSKLHYNHRPENLVLLEDRDRARFINEHCEAIEFKQMSLLDPEDKNFFRSPLFNTELRYISVDKNFGYALVDNWQAKELQVYRFGAEETWNKFWNDRVAMFANDNS